MKGCRQPGVTGVAAESRDASRAPATAPRLTTTSLCKGCGESLSAYLPTNPSRYTVGLKSVAQALMISSIHS